MKYLELAQLYEQLESTSKRLEKTDIISKFLKKVNEKDLPELILLIQGKLFPNWDEQKIGVAARLILKAIINATGMSEQQIEREWKKTGDLGKTAELLTKKKMQQTLFSRDLTVSKVFDNLRKLATLEGKGTVAQKVSLIAELITNSKPLEARYIVRTILEELRIGVGDSSVRDALVWAYLYQDIKYDKKTNKIELKNRDEYNKIVDTVQRAYDLTNDFSQIAIFAHKGLSSLEKVSLKVGTPIQVMLGPKEKDAASALDRVGRPCQAEFKYDGFRLQIHKDKDKIYLFTRNLENVTNQFPDVVKYVKSNVKGSSFILDSEAVGFSPKTDKYMPFQHISQRIKRKYDISRLQKELPVQVTIFDCVYHNGKTLLNKPFKERRDILKKIVKQEKRKIILSEASIVKNEEELNIFFKKSKDAGNEGLMLKKLDAPYQPGKRVGYMVKMKSAEEPLDLVITEAEWGEGKRANWLSSFTVACIDENGNFLDIGKVGTGVKEKSEEGVTFKQLTELLKPLITSEKGKKAKIKPKIVVEVIYDEIQKSPKYSSGYALRFPRIIRLRHMEKSANDSNDLEYIEELYFSQKK